MPRRHFLRYTRATKINEQILQQYVRFLLPGDLYHHLDRFPQVNAPALFGNNHPLELEIGCGSAEPLCAQAKAHPEKNYLGIDISGPSIRKAAEVAATQELKNILFLNADFHLLYPLLMPESIQTVYLHFPDPHTRPGRQKRRIFNERFLDQMAVTLEPGGILSVMTDHKDFFLEMLTLLESDKRFAKLHSERYLLGFENEVKSHFQRIWEHYGETVFRFIACRSIS